MAQTMELVETVKAKIELIEEQNKQVHAMLEHEFLKLTSKAREVLEKEEQDQDELKEMNLQMDTVLGCSISLKVKMKAVLSSTMTGDTDRVVAQASSGADVSSTGGDYESRMSGHKSKSRILPESAPTPCDNEESQNVIVDKYNKDLGIQIKEGKTLSSQVLDQQGQRLASLEKLSQQTRSVMTEEIKNLEKTFEDNSKKTKLELDTKIDYFHREFQKTLEQNMAIIKEQASKLGKVEEKIKKMNEKEQERWLQIDSLHTDVESLKDNQRDKQILEKIQGLEKHMEKQCDSLQDQVGKIEPVIQMSQELAHKISTLATDEQVQELIQTTTATSKSLQELTSTVEDTERSVRDCVTQCERDENRRREMEDRVTEIETKIDQHTKELEETKSQLDDSKKNADNMSTRLDKLEHPRVGFTAFYTDKMPALKQGTITDFTTVLCNEGEGFNPATGEFICPADGLYGIFANLRQLRDGVVLLLVKSQSSDEPKEVCRLKTDMANTSSCGLGVAMLQKGDSVFVHVSLKDGDPGLTHYSSFSCFRIA